MKICPNCNKQRRHKFCQECGSNTIIETHPSISIIQTALDELSDKHTTDNSFHRPGIAMFKELIQIVGDKDVYLIPRENSRYVSYHFVLEESFESKFGNMVNRCPGWKRMFITFIDENKINDKNKFMTKFHILDEKEIGLKGLIYKFMAKGREIELIQKYQ